MNLDLLRTLLAMEGPVALATVLQVKGSAPRHAGAMLLAGPEGLRAGSVGGGRGEALVLAACREALEAGQPRVVEVDMQGLEAEGPAMVCGGVSRILVEPLRDRAPYRTALARLERGQRVLLVKRPAAGTVAVMTEDGTWAHGAEASADLELATEALASGRPALEGDLFYAPLAPREQLLILGGGHVGRALAALAAGLGFTVTVGDDRPEFADPARFPAGVATLTGSYTDLIAGFPFDPATYVVIATRGHLCDLECVRAVLARPYRYAGLMGSRRKCRLVLDQALKDGHDPARVEALYAPIGLAIGAETPEELAVALAAELVAVRRHAPCLAALQDQRKLRRAQA